MHFITTNNKMQHILSNTNVAQNFYRKFLSNFVQKYDDHSCYSLDHHDSLHLHSLPNLWPVGDRFRESIWTK